MTFSTSSSDQGQTRAERVFDAQEWGISLVEVDLKDMRGLWFYPRTVGHLSVASVTINTDLPEDRPFNDLAVATTETIFLAKTEYDPKLMSRLERLASIALPERCVLAEETYGIRDNKVPYLEGAEYAYENDWNNLQVSTVLDHLDTAARIASKPDRPSPTT